MLTAYQGQQSPVAGAKVENPPRACRNEFQQCRLALAAMGDLIGAFQVVAGVFGGSPEIHGLGCSHGEKVYGTYTLNLNESRRNGFPDDSTVAFMASAGSHAAAVGARAKYAVFGSTSPAVPNARCAGAHQTCHTAGTGTARRQQNHSQAGGR